MTFEDMIENLNDHCAPMEAEIFETRFAEVDTDHGIEFLNLEGWVGPATAETLKDCLQGNEVYGIDVRQGFLARLQMPGCLDTTPWSGHDTKEKAGDELWLTFGPYYPWRTSLKRLGGSICW